MGVEQREQQEQSATSEQVAGDGCKVALAAGDTRIVELEKQAAEAAESKAAAKKLADEIEGGPRGGDRGARGVRTPPCGRAQREVREGTARGLRGRRRQVARGRALTARQARGGDIGRDGAGAHRGGHQRGGDVRALAWGGGSHGRRRVATQGQRHRIP